MVHRAIKPQNIFINQFGNYKIGKFGCFFEKKVTSEAETLTRAYMSFQQRKALLGGSYNAFKADVFALGKTLLALASLEIPKQWETYLVDEKATQSLLYSPVLKSIILRMLSESEEDRPTMQEVLEYATHMRDVLDDAVLFRAVRKSLGLERNTISGAAVHVCHISHVTEVFKSERAGKPVIAKVYKFCSSEEMTQLSTSYFSWCMGSSLHSALLHSLTVNFKSELYEVQYMLESRGNLDMGELEQIGVRPRFSEFVVYTKGQIIYENRMLFSVFEGHYKLFRKPVAVKQYHCKDVDDLNGCIREALLLVKVESLYTSKLFDISIRAETKATFQMNLIMERPERDLAGDVKERVAQKKPYGEFELMQILVEVSDALIFAKMQGVANNNIKPRSILIASGHYRITNFGSDIAEEENELTGNLEYLSPEMMRQKVGEDVAVEAYQSDMYSLGMTLLHLAKLKFPYRVAEAWGSSTELEQAVEREIQALRGYSSELLGLLKKMVTMDPGD